MKIEAQGKPFIAVFLGKHYDGKPSTDSILCKVKRRTDELRADLSEEHLETMKLQDDKVFGLFPVHATVNAKGEIEFDMCSPVFYYVESDPIEIVRTDSVAEMARIVASSVCVNDSVGLIEGLRIVSEKDYIEEQHQ